jgi:outer membrane protein assembly factor BamB
MRISFGFVCAIAFTTIGLARAADDWPTFGRDHTHNAVSPEHGAPAEWHIKDGAKTVVNDKVTEKFADAKNIRWTARLGARGIGGPVVAGGLVWVGTNNYRPRDPADFRVLSNGKKEPIDKSVLMCFRESDGAFLWQYAVPRLGGGVSMHLDWPDQAMGSTPLVEGDRLWVVNNRSEVVCLDVGPLRRGDGVPKEVWKVDLRAQFGVVPHAPLMAGGFQASVAADRDNLYVVTGNGIGEDFAAVAAPTAPSLICFDKANGKPVWTDNSPGKNILAYQVSSPLVAEINGRRLCVVGQGDGWLRAFDAATGKVVWKCDLNAKDAVWRGSGQWTRNSIAATPVLYENRIYVGMGSDPEHLYGVGWLYCVDPTKGGDVSPELEAAPGKGKPNPNSAVVWRFGGPEKHPAKVSRDFVFGRTISNCTLHDGLCYACDQLGSVYCLDARTGKPNWVHDTRCELFATPLWADGRLYVGTADGDTLLFAHGREKKLLATIDMGKAFRSGPVFANGTLFLLTDSMLFAVREGK